MIILKIKKLLKIEIKFKGDNNCLFMYIYYIIVYYIILNDKNINNIN